METPAQDITVALKKFKTGLAKLPDAPEFYLQRLPALKRQPGFFY